MTTTTTLKETKTAQALLHRAALRSGKSSVDLAVECVWSEIRTGTVRQAENLLLRLGGSPEEIRRVVSAQVPKSG